MEILIQHEEKNPHSLLHILDSSSMSQTGQRLGSILLVAYPSFLFFSFLISFYSEKKNVYTVKISNLKEAQTKSDKGFLCLEVFKMLLPVSQCTYWLKTPCN